MLDQATIQASLQDSGTLAVVYASALSIVLSGLVAWTYGITFHGLSYSRNYVQALILVSLVASTVMQAVGDSIARGLGILGALAVVRFRTSLTDPKDLVFLFAAIASGLGCGIYAWSISAIGTVAFCLTAWVLYRADVGHAQAFDGMVRFSTSAEASSLPAVEQALRQDLRHFALVALREVEGGRSLDHAYHVKFRKGRDARTLLASLSTIPTLGGLHFMMQESTTEL